MKYITVDPRLAARSAYKGFGAGMLTEIADLWPIMAREVSAQLEDPSKWGDLASYMVVMAIWNAGHIQGIREERAKRRSRNERVKNRALLAQEFSRDYMLNRLMLLLSGLSTSRLDTVYNLVCAYVLG